MNKRCDLCPSTNGVKTTKIGLALCSECVKPVAECHEVLGGQVVKWRKDDGMHRDNRTR